MYALHHKGAKWGNGYGLQGQSFAIPTKDRYMKTLSLERIKQWVESFIKDAKFAWPHLKFQVTCIGCGLAGLDHKDVAPMFEGASNNCYFDELWKPYLGDKYNYWGTF